MKGLLERYPMLSACQNSIREALECWIDCFEQGGTLYICGNGGSAADAGHISGELMKGFLKRRPLPKAQKEAMLREAPGLDPSLLEKLQGGLPAIPLPALSALNSAVCNDTDPSLVYAQSLVALARPGDLLLCISTSGNSENVVMAAQVGKALGMKVVSLTGETGGKLRKLSHVCVNVPGTETYAVQELHLPVYHYLCEKTEARFFAE